MAKKDDPDYHFTTDMTNEAIEWIKFQQAMTPDKPFMVYYATGAVHAHITPLRNGLKNTKESLMADG